MKTACWEWKKDGFCVHTITPQGVANYDYCLHSFFDDAAEIENPNQLGSSVFFYQQA